MSEINDILCEIESREKPDSRQIESLLYMYADMPGKFDGRMDGAELFDELTRLASLCKRCGFPNEVLLFCYRRAFSSIEPSYEQFEEVGIRLIGLYSELYGFYEPDDEDKDCIKKLSALLNKYRARLTDKLNRADAADIIEVYEAVLYQMLFGLMRSGEAERSFLFSVILICSRAGFNKTVPCEKALGFFQTVDMAFTRLSDAKLKKRPDGREQYYEMIIESAALAYEGMGNILPEEQWGTSIVYYKLALEIRLKCLDRVYPVSCCRYSADRFGRLRLILTQMIPEADIVSEFAEGFERLEQAYRGIRSDEECSLYGRLSDEFYRTIVEMGQQETENRKAAQAT